MNFDRTPPTKTSPSTHLSETDQRKALLAIAVTLGVWMTSVTAYGAGLGFLKESPVRYFTDEDWRLLKNASQRALEKGQDGETSEWQNPDTDSSGALTPTRSFRQDGSECRTLIIQTAAAGRTSEGTYDFCKQADGTWKMAP